MSEFNFICVQDRFGYLHNARENIDCISLTTMFSNKRNQNLSILQHNIKLFDNIKDYKFPVYHLLIRNNLKNPDISGNAMTGVVKQQNLIISQRLSIKSLAELLGKNII